MRHRSQLLVVTALVIWILLLFTQPIFALRRAKQAELDSINAKLRENRQKLERVKAQEKSLLNELQDAEVRLSTVQKELDRLDNELRAVSEQKRATEAELRTLQQELAETNYQLKIVEDRLAEQECILNNRLTDIYKNGKASFIAVALNSQDFFNFLNRIHFVNLILKQDATLLQNIRQTKETVEAKKAEIEAQREAIEQKKDLLAQQENRVASLTAVTLGRKNELRLASEKKQDLLLRVQADKASYVKAEQELERASREIARMLQTARGNRPRPVLVSSGRFIWPVQGEITSGFEWRTHPIFQVRSFHTGIDIAAPYGEPIAAADDGVVFFVGWKGGYGNTVIVSHSNGLATLYAHASTLLVEPGQTVKKGETIARVGASGYVTGPHLHFEIRVEGEPQNPLGWL